MSALRFAVAGAVALTLACAARGGDKAAKTSKTQEKLLGVWKVVGEKATLPEGTTVEFTADSRLILTVKEGPDKEAVSVTGAYQLAGESQFLASTTKERHETFEIVKLTATELVVKNEKERTDTFKKVR
jgi:uncharacterized protein (TIGR03066 family)